MTDVLPVSVVAVEAVVLSVSVVESPPNLSSSRLLFSSPSPITSRRLKSDSGSLRKFASEAQMVASTREKSVVSVSQMVLAHVRTLLDRLIPLRRNHTSDFLTPFAFSNASRSPCMKKSYRSKDRSRHGQPSTTPKNDGGCSLLTCIERGLGLVRIDIQMRYNRFLQKHTASGRAAEI